MPRRPALAFAFAAALSLAGCSTTAGTLPRDAFWSHLQALCGKAYGGRIVADTPATSGPDPFRGQPLVMHVRECRPDEIRVPFHVGADRSRTWVFTRTAAGLRLKHDHRHEDGQPDALTQYGGDTTQAGTAMRQEFPADAMSKAMFLAQDRAVSLPNVWAIEVEPGRAFFYELARPGRLFRVEFDLTREVPAPPVPWGAAR